MDVNTSLDKSVFQRDCSPKSHLKRTLGRHHNVFCPLAANMHKILLAKSVFMSISRKIVDSYLLVSKTIISHMTILGYIALEEYILDGQ